MELQEILQQKVAKMKGLQCFPCEEKLRELGLSSPGASHQHTQIPEEGKSTKRRERLFSVVPNDKTKGNRHKLKQRWLCLTIRRHFCAMQTMENWHSCPESFWTLLLWGASKATRTWSWASALGSTTGEGLGQRTQRSLLTSISQWFCEEKFKSYMQKTAADLKTVPDSFCCLLNQLVLSDLLFSTFL